MAASEAPASFTTLLSCGASIALPSAGCTGVGASGSVPPSKSKSVVVVSAFTHVASSPHVSPCISHNRPMVQVASPGGQLGERSAQRKGNKTRTVCVRLGVNVRCNLLRNCTGMSPAMPGYTETSKITTMLPSRAAPSLGNTVNEFSPALSAGSMLPATPRCQMRVDQPEDSLVPTRTLTSTGRAPGTSVTNCTTIAVAGARQAVSWFAVRIEMSAIAERARKRCIAHRIALFFHRLRSDLLQHSISVR